MKELLESPSKAILEVQSRLQKLFPEYIISRLPKVAVGVHADGGATAEGGMLPAAAGAGAAGAAGAGATGEIAVVSEEATPAVKEAVAATAAALGRGNGMHHDQSAARKRRRYSQEKGTGEGNQSTVTTSGHNPSPAPAPAPAPAVNTPTYAANPMVAYAAAPAPAAAASPSSNTPTYAANPMVANAAVAGDVFQWHIDADPNMLPGYGYTNREPGKPYWVTLLLYLNNGCAFWHVCFFLLLVLLPPWVLGRGDLGGGGGWFYLSNIVSVAIVSASTITN